MEGLVSPADLHGWLAEGKPVTLVDVRPRELFLKGHLPGAVSIPRDALENRMKDIPRDIPVVTY